MTVDHDHDPQDGGGRAPRPADRPESGETAVDRFHDADGIRIAIGLLIAVAAHFAFLELAPAIHAPTFGEGVRQLEAVELPPPVEIPPPPEQIARPATPTVAAADVDEDVTIAPTTFESNPAEELPPPPETRGTSPEDRPSFIPRDVDPRLTNEREVRRLLKRHYPPGLREAGIGSRVVIWVYVDRTGQVTKAQVHTPSDYEAFNEAALKVARRMEFRPAINQDRPIGVWASHSIRFSVDRE